MDEERVLAEVAGEPLDDADARTLRRVRGMYEAADPVPAGLVDRVRFAVALDTMFDEVARITRVPVDAVAVRGEPTDTRTQTLTFSAEHLTAMVTLTRPEPGRLRLDGWLAPAAPLRVVLRLGDGPERGVSADEQGRFSFADLEEGFAQLRFLPAGGAPDGPSGTVVTPVFEL
jgi:hypothetical protein